MTGVESMWEQLGGVAIFNLLTAWPLWRIYRRAGLPGWWSLAAFAPLVGLVAAVGILAHAGWPNLPRRPKAPAHPPKARRTLAAAAGRE